MDAFELIIAVAILVLVAVFIANGYKRKKTGESSKYVLDERQQKALDRGAHWSMNAMIGALLVVSVLYSTSDGGYALSPAFVTETIGCVGLAIYLVNGIWCDAYFGIKGAQTSTLVIWVLLGIVYLINGIGSILIEGSTDEFESVFFLPCGVLFTLIAIVALVRNRLDNREAQEQ